jgi:hypothetical protein
MKASRILSWENMLDEVGLPLQKQTRQPVPLMATAPSDDDK